MLRQGAWFTSANVDVPLRRGIAPEPTMLEPFSTPKSSAALGRRGVPNHHGDVVEGRCAVDVGAGTGRSCKGVAELLDLEQTK